MREAAAAALVPHTDDLVRMLVMQDQQAKEAFKETGKYPALATAQQMFTMDGLVAIGSPAVRPLLNAYAANGGTGYLTYQSILTRARGIDPQLRAALEDSDPRIQELVNDCLDVRAERGLGD